MLCILSATIANNFRGQKAARLLLVFITLLAASCKKDDAPPPNQEPELPPYTQEGKNILAFRLDGKPITMNVQNASFDPNTSSLIIVRAYTKDTALSMDWYVTYTGLDSPLHLDNTVNRSTILRFQPLTTSIFSVSDTTKLNVITFMHYNTTVLAGTFELALKYNDPSRPNVDSTVFVTDGRFDLRVQ